MKAAYGGRVMQLAYSTNFGSSYIGNSENLLETPEFSNLLHKVNLIFTSPPFPLTRQKSYGNLNGNYYIEWLSNFAPIFSKLLAEDGSLVIELGNAWDRGSHGCQKSRSTEGQSLASDFLQPETKQLPKGASGNT